MKTILFKKNGELCLLDRFTQEVEKVNNLINYLDCPVEVEKGVTFGNFFSHIIKEKEILNKVFKETMGNSSIDNFLGEWGLPATPLEEVRGIEYIKAYKIFDYIELPTQENFVDIRIDFDGIGKEEELYNLEFIPLNDLKYIPFKLSNNISIYRSTSNLKGEELFFQGKSFTTLFELVGTILYVITIHGNSEG